MTTTPFAGAVLTGGRSTRMGRDKAAIVIDGRPMADRVADALRAAGAHPVVTIDSSVDRHPGEGPLGAVLTGLQRPDVAAPIVAILACDLLAPDPAAIASLVRALAADPHAGAAVPLSDGRPQWVHAAWRTAVALPVLDGAFSRGVRSFGAACSELRIVHVDDLDPRALADADSPGDLPGPEDHAVAPRPGQRG